MADYHVWDDGGSDSTGTGAVDNPWATIAHALAQSGPLDYLRFKANRAGKARPAFGRNVYYNVRFVDAAQGTDDGSHGTRPATGAWATLQYAVDNAPQSAWIFCKGTETPSATLDIDVAGPRVVEGYSSTPRDGGFYNLNNAGVTGYGITFAAAGHSHMLANLNVYGQSSHGIYLGSPSPTWAVLWNCQIDAPGNRRAIYCLSSTTNLIALFCKTTSAQYGLYGTGAVILAIGCDFRECSYGVRMGTGVTLYGCYLKDNSVSQVTTAGVGALIRSTLYNSGGTGIFFGQMTAVVDSIIKDAATYAIDGTQPYLPLNVGVDASPGGGEDFREGYFAGNTVITGDPKMVDPANNLIALQADSAYLAAGEPGLHALGTDAARGAPVLGAYQPPLFFLTPPVQARGMHVDPNIL